MGDSAKPTNIKIPGDSLAEMLNDKKQIVTIAPLIAEVVKLIDNELINEIEKLFAKSASNNPRLKYALTALHTALKSFYKPPLPGAGLLPVPISFKDSSSPIPVQLKPAPGSDKYGMGGGRRRTKNAYFYNKRRKTRRRKGKK
jgi:hypothetical protein